MELVVVTGMSGAGKSEALKYFEDIGYFAIDNLPISMITNIADIPFPGSEKAEKIALVTDVRGSYTFEELFTALEKLRSEGIECKTVFLDASDDVLMRRFSETRRIHPLATEGLRVADTIAAERKLLEKVREKADMIIDTSQLNIHELRTKLNLVFKKKVEARSLAINIVAFGYKFGLPLDADIIIDTRFLPNPYWVEELRPLDGTDEKVVDLVLAQEEATALIEGVIELLELMIPGYEREGRMIITLGVGCTGGRHRSVVVANELARRLNEKSHPASVTARDIEKS